MVSKTILTLDDSLLHAFLRNWRIQCPSAVCADAPNVVNAGWLWIRWKTWFQQGMLAPQPGSNVVTPMASRTTLHCQATQVSASVANLCVRATALCNVGPRHASQWKCVVVRFDGPKEVAFVLVELNMGNV
eukprot:CAMPEP_0194520310 /NCGR_PEP_ID=MMETSP0253-20130528/54234_1 /TAXON_ID=2966 /ORGANISM="Noctiluca scintillans" /LENGTH=130 /DNA_ID=CAMNT_0039364527 /DNA_START=153 /DNA_END=542 /DNA_ORIENTATION=+